MSFNLVYYQQIPFGIRPYGFRQLYVPVLPYPCLQISLAPNLNFTDLLSTHTAVTIISADPPLADLLLLHRIALSLITAHHRRRHRNDR
jgi:hypothetical protein